MTNRRVLIVAASLLLVVGIFLLFFRLPHARSKVEIEGVPAEGQVRLQDSQPFGDGRTVYRISFTYLDAENKNHMVTNQLDDLGQWDKLKAGTYVKPVYYLPSNLDIAYIPGAIAIEKPNGGGIAVSLGSPHSGAMRFLAWSALLASIPVWYLAFRAPAGGPKPKKKPPIMSRR